MRKFNMNENDRDMIFTRNAVHKLYLLLGRFEDDCKRSYAKNLAQFLIENIDMSVEGRALDVPEDFYLGSQCKNKMDYLLVWLEVLEAYEPDIDGELDEFLLVMTQRLHAASRKTALV